MTRFDESCESPMFMSITISFCIAAYLEQLGVTKYDDEKLKRFMDETSGDIEKWLLEESKTSGKDQ